MSRNCKGAAVDLLQETVKEGAQIVLTTHSPFVLARSFDRDLQGVYRLVHGEGDGPRVVHLGDVRVGSRRRGFSDIRKLVPFDAELLQALFSHLVVVYEGETDAAFYSAVMAPLLPLYRFAAVSGEGDGTLDVAHWFKVAGYQVVVVVDGNKHDFLRKLRAEGLPFVALPDGTSLEKVMEEGLQSLDLEDQVDVLLESIAVDDFVRYREPLIKTWPCLRQLPEWANPGPKPEVTVATVRQHVKGCHVGQEITPISYVRLLADYKHRHVAHKLGAALAQRSAVPTVARALARTLDQIRRGCLPFGAYQIKPDGSIAQFTGDGP